MLRRSGARSQEAGEGQTALTTPTQFWRLQQTSASVELGSTKPASCATPKGLALPTVGQSLWFEPEKVVRSQINDDAVLGTPLIKPAAQKKKLAACARTRLRGEKAQQPKRRADSLRAYCHRPNLAAEFEHQDQMLFQYPIGLLLVRQHCRSS